MNFLSYIISPRTILSFVTSFFRKKHVNVITSTDENEKNNYEPKNCDNENDSEDYDFHLVKSDRDLPIIYNEYIDVAIENTTHDYFKIVRPINYGMASLYILSLRKNVELMLTTIYVVKCDNLIHIYEQDREYIWNTLFNTITGQNDDILFHFKNKPYFDS